jgi:hypothetical protein
MAGVANVAIKRWLHPRAALSPRKAGGQRPGSFAGKKKIFARARLSPRPLRLINQDRLLPAAWRLVGAMNAARPAAGAFLAFQQFVTGSFNAALPRLWLFGVIHPADELIATERRQVLPQHKDFRI